MKIDMNKDYVITINREVGSGGRTVGRMLAQRLGVPFYDKALINSLTEMYHLSVEEIEELKDGKPLYNQRLVKVLAELEKMARYTCLHDFWRKSLIISRLRDFEPTQSLHKAYTEPTWFLHVSDLSSGI